MQYLDTSILVAALTNERETGRIQSWLTEQDPDQLAISDWVVAEFSAALSVKLRSGRIAVEHRADALSAFALLTADSLRVASVTALHFRTAARFADQYPLGLRAGDALHLAIAGDTGALLSTLDRQLAEAGPVLGVRTQLL